MSGVLHYPFVQANGANFSKGRQGYRPLWFVLHATATKYADNYPANLGKYWSNNPVQVSVHFCVSDTQTYQYVNCDDTAYQTRNPGNLRGVGVELVGQATWTRNEWLAHKPMLRRAAQLCAEVSAAYGLKCDVTRLGDNALKARASGLTCHADMTRVFAGSHTDPGENFPWDYFGTELATALVPVHEQRQIQATAQAADEEDAMAGVSNADFNALAANVARLNKQSDRTDDIIGGQGMSYADSNLAKQLGYVLKKLNERMDVVEAKIDELKAATS